MEGDTQAEARRRGATPAEVIATLAIVGAFAVFALSKPVMRRLSAHPSREQCAAMLDRYAEQQARAANRVPVPSHLSPGAPDAAKCARELTADEVECAMRSNDADALERCLP